MHKKNELSEINGTTTKTPISKGSILITINDDNSIAITSKGTTTKEVKDAAMRLYQAATDAERNV